MIKCEKLARVFNDNDLNFFTGVPDSTFKEWISFLIDNPLNNLTNIIAINECEAAAIASGYHLATNKVAVVYMQNSGLGKVVNPYTSLLSKDVYSIPAIFMIGWRGEPEKKDEPQHKLMGKITLSLLDVLEIPYLIMPDNLTGAEIAIKSMKELAINNSSPVALIIKSSIFEKYSHKVEETSLELSREDAIKILADNLHDTAIVSTTGKTSRELYEYRISQNKDPSDFYTVGSMGCASSIAFGISKNTSKKVVIFDGDGAALMQMGTFATIGHYKPNNLFHVIFDNAGHDSTGGQPTVSTTVDFTKVALACGYNEAFTVTTEEDLINKIDYLNNKSGPLLLVVKVNLGSREDLGRPKNTPIENKDSFIDSLR